MASAWTNSFLRPAVRILPRTTGVRESGRAFTTRIIPQTRPFQPRPSQSIFRRNYAQVVVQDRTRGRTRRILTTVVIGLGSFALGGYLSLSYAPPIITSFIFGKIPTDEESLHFEAGDDWTKEIDNRLMNNELAKACRTSGEWREYRPHMKFPDEVRQHNLTASTLMTKDTVPVPPVYFQKNDGSELIAIYYVGTHVSGHPGVVHGGFLATILDEGLATCAFASLPNKVGVTAQLDIAYRRPTKAAQFLVLGANTVKVEGRKVWTDGYVQELDAYLKDLGGDGKSFTQPLVEAKALFIEPRHAKYLKSLYRQVT